MVAGALCWGVQDPAECSGDISLLGMGTEALAGLWKLAFFSLSRPAPVPVSVPPSWAGDLPEQLEGNAEQDGPDVALLLAGNTGLQMVLPGNVILKLSFKQI